MTASKAKDQVTGSGARATAKEVAEQSTAAAEHGPTTRQASCPQAPSPSRAGTLAQGPAGGVFLPSPTSLSTNPSARKRLLQPTAEPLERALLKSTTRGNILSCPLPYGSVPSLYCKLMYTTSAKIFQKMNQITSNFRENN